MNTADLLNRLEAEGVSVSLNLKLKADAQPPVETLDLIKENRDDLITLLTLRHVTDSDYHLNITTSTGKAYVMAKPHHIKEAVALYPWGVVSDSENRLITKWGDVPEGKLLGLRDLEMGEQLTPEQEAA